MANFSTDSGEMNACVGVQYIISCSSMDSLKSVLRVTGVSSHMSSTSRSEGKEGMEDTIFFSSSILPAGRRIGFLGGTGGEFVAVQLHLLFVGVTKIVFFGIMFVILMVEVESFVERVDCPTSEGIELKEELVLVITFF